MSTAEQSQPSEIGLAEAAKRMAMLSEGPRAKPEPRQTEAADVSADPETTADEADETLPEDALAALPDEGDEADDGETVEDAADAEEQADEVDLSDDTLVTVKIDGKTQQITLKEAREGYQRQADYSRNMHALRQEKQQIAAVAQQVEIERNQYGQLVGALRQQLEQMIPQEPNWEQLHREDPLNFPIVEKQWRDYKERLAAARAEEQRLAHLQHYEVNEQLRQKVEQGVQELQQLVPEWKEPERFKAAQSKLREYGRKLGYSDEELSQVYNARDVLVLDKARRYDALMANRPKPQVQGQNAPKPLRAGSTASSPRQAPQISRMRERLKQSGSVDDAAALFGLLGTRK